MKLIDQSHEILSVPEGLLEMIETAGRTCYKSEDKIGCTIPEEQQGPENCPDNMLSWNNTINFGPEEGYKPCSSECQHHSSNKFVQTLIKRGHHAMIEFGDIIVRFVTNRGVTHELVRHRLCSFAQESTRYVKYDGTMEFIRPVWCESEKKKWDSLTHAWNLSMEMAEENYKYLLKFGWRPEQAREVLPNSLKTEIVVKGNIREWRHIFSLRCSKAAHPQIRALMIPLRDELKKKIPVIFDDLN